MAGPVANVPENLDGVITYNVAAASAVCVIDKEVTLIFKSSSHCVSTNDLDGRLCQCYIDQQRRLGRETHHIKAPWGQCAFIMNDLISVELVGKELKLNFGPKHCLLLKYPTPELAASVNKGIVSNITCGIFTLPKPQ
jgi:hypothetical protein